MKSQVTLNYENNETKIHTIVLSIQHASDFIYEEFKNNIVNKVISPLVKKYKLNNDYILKLNANGLFTLGGPKADTGLTGRKIVVDTYGAHAHHGGGSFSGKDYTKVDRSAAYVAR
jgi:S-adenosylmethionine synthetase